MPWMQIPKFPSDMKDIYREFFRELLRDNADLIADVIAERMMQNSHA